MTRAELARAARGSPSDWYNAVKRARDDGWTQREVDRVLFWSHPATWAWGAMGALVLVAFIVGD